MKCPFCGEQESKVVDSRHSEDGVSIRRRREYRTAELPENGIFRSGKNLGGIGYAELRLGYGDGSKRRVRD